MKRGACVARESRGAPSRGRNASSSRSTMAALHHTAAHARAHGTHECLSRQRLVEVRSTVGTQRVPPRSGATKGAPRAAVPPPFILPSTLLTWLLSLLPHHKYLKGRSEEHTSELTS